MDGAVAMSLTNRAKSWITLARPQFHSVGMLPFLLGFMMARHQQGAFRWDLFVWGMLAVILIMLSTYWAGECFDHEEDRISGERGRSKFAGGTGVIQAGSISREASFYGSIVSLFLAAAVGLVLWLGYKTGPWTVPLGLLGMVGGFLYSTPPVRWVSTGVGEIWIGLCYGFLPVMTGYYLPTGSFDNIVFLVAIPVAATIFNVILANEFPDFISDKTAGKTNLLVRAGRTRGAQIYAAATAVTWIGFVLSVFAGIPLHVLGYAAIPFLCSLYVTIRMLHGGWQNPRELEVLCGLGIFVNLGTTMAYILAFYWG